MPVPTATSSFSSLSRAKTSVGQLLVSGTSPSLRNVRLGGISEHAAGSLPENSLAGINLDSAAPSNTTLLHVSLQFSAIRWKNGHLALIPHTLAGPKGTSRISMDPTFLGTAPLATHSSGSGPPPLYLGPDFALSPELHTDSVWVAATVRDSPVVQVFKAPANGIPESHEQMSVPSAILASHERQATHVAFHPLICGLLATAARDDTILLWDVEKMLPITSLTTSAVANLGFDRLGERITWIDSNTSSVMLMDPRATGPSALTEIPQTYKPGSRYSWLNPHSLVTCGSRGPETFITVWDPRNNSSPTSELQVQNVKSSGIPFLMPDPSLQAVYFATRGESSIKTFHCRNGLLELAADCKATKQHYAIATLPKLSVNPRYAEIARFCRIREDGIMELVPMTLIRKESHISLQSDLYPALATMSTSLKPGDFFEPDKPALRPDTFQFKAIEASEPDSPTSPTFPAVATLVLASNHGTPAAMAADLTRSLSTMSRKLSIRSIVAVKGLVTSATASSSLAALAEDLPAPCSTIMRKATRPHSLAAWTWTAAHVELMSHGRLVIVEQSPNISMFFHINRDIEAVTSEGDTLLICPKGGIPIVRLQCTSAEQAQEWRGKLNPYITIRLIPRAPVRIASRLEVKLPATLTPATHGHSPSSSISSSPLLTAGFRSCYVTLEDTGHILFYTDESAFVQPDSKWPPFAMLEIKDILSVRFTDLMNGNEQDADAMAMTTFSATMPSSQVILRARSKHDAANWIVSLHQVAMLVDSPEAGLDEPAGGSEADLLAGTASAGSPLDCEVDEGPITVQNHQALVPGLSASNGSCWLSVLRTQLYYFQSSTSTRVLARIETVHSIVIDLAAGTISVACERGIIVHAVERSQFSWWKQVFERLFRASGTLLRDLGVSKESWTKLDLGNFESSLVQLGSVGKGQLPMLAVIRGRNAPVQVVPVHFSELDDTEACVLDLGSTVYQWNGPSSCLPVRARAMDLANKIRSKERKNQANIVQITQNQPRTALFDFLKRLGYTLDEIPSFKRAAEPSAIASSGGLRLYRIYLEMHSPRSELVHECNGSNQEQPRKRYLDTNSVVLLVDEPNELWIWVGKQSSLQDRLLATTVAARMHLKVQFRSVFRIQEGFEPMVFQHKFADMDTSLPIALRPAKPSGHSRIACMATASSKQPTIDLNDVLANAEATDRLAAEQVAGKLKDTDQVELFLVEDFTTHRVPSKGGAALTSLARNKAYIVLHTEILNANKRCTGYFFQGSSATQLDKGSSALLTVALCKDAKAAAEVTQVRVEEGFEPVSFFGLFEGKEILLLLGSSKGSKRQGGPDSATMQVVVDVRLTRHRKLIAKECLIDLSTVSQFHFSLLLGSKGIIHAGTHAPLLSATLLLRIRSHFKTWDLATAIQPVPEKDSIMPQHPRLFSVSNASGHITAKYVWPFAQPSLSRNGVQVLDTTRAIFCWLGSEVETAEIVHALKFAIQLCERLGRKKAMVVYPSQEPGEFTACFHGWIGQPVPLESSKAMFQEAKFYLSELTRTVYSLKELQSMDLTKAFVDLTRLEDYLSDVEFEATFKMTRDAYKGLPLWKQEKVKKEVGLY